MKVLLFHGRGLIGAAIRWFTRGDYSHAAFLMENGDLWESWQGNGKSLWQNSGVRRLDSSARTDWSGVDTYIVVNPDTQESRPLTLEEETNLGKWLKIVEGTGYDWPGYFRFLTRSRKPSETRMFCSDLVVEGMAAIGLPLFNMSRGDEADPNLLKRSLRLKKA